MTTAHLIEIGEDTAGLAVAGEGGFQFFSSDPRFDRLHGGIHADLAELERAVLRIVRDERAAGAREERKSA